MNYLSFKSISSCLKEYNHSTSFEKTLAKPLFEIFGVFMNPANRNNYLNSIMIPYEFTRFRMKDQSTLDKTPCFVMFDSKYGLIKVKYNYSHAMKEDYEDLTDKVWESWSPSKEDFELNWAIFPNPGTGVKTNDYYYQTIKPKYLTICFEDIFRANNFNSDYIFRPILPFGPGKLQDNLTFFEKIFLNPNRVLFFKSVSSAVVLDEAKTSSTFKLCLGEITSLLEGVKVQALSMGPDIHSKYYHFTGDEFKYRYELYDMTEVTEFWDMYYKMNIKDSTEGNSEKEVKEGDIENGN